MTIGAPASRLLWGVLLAAIGFGGLGWPRSALSGPFCSGEYADSLLVLAPQARLMEQAPYSYCIRSVAIYACLSYAPDVNLRRSRKTAISQGTGFGFRRDKGGTYLLTNYHVAEFPLVTDDTHPVGNIPLGCKRISDTLHIVDNESDSYDRDDIFLTRVVQDPQLDASVLRARDTTLNILPWKLGKSAALRERNVVEVRGFPLGVFQATSDGKVVSAYDHDTDKDWDHDDFVIDALLSPGNSGSPVLAVSCRTGEFELLGIYHAGYTDASALNVVVGIDNLRDLILTLKKKPRGHPDGAILLDEAARAQLMREAPTILDAFFPFGALFGLVLQSPDAALLFALFPHTFPLHTVPIAVFEDRPKPGEFGELGRVWLGGPHGLKMYRHADLDAETLGQVNRILDGVRHVSLAARAYREASEEASGSREQFERMSRLERTLARSADTRSDLAQLSLDLADRLGPRGKDTLVTLSALMTSTHASSLHNFAKP